MSGDAGCGCARQWSATASAAGAAAYVRYFDETLAQQLRALPGYLGALVLLAPDGPDKRIVVITRWTSMDAVRAFAGEDVTVAVIEPEARALLSTWDERVVHFDVALEASREEVE